MRTTECCWCELCGSWRGILGSWVTEVRECYFWCSVSRQNDLNLIGSDSATTEKRDFLEWPTLSSNSFALILGVNKMSQNLTKSEAKFLTFNPKYGLKMYSSSEQLCWLKLTNRNYHCKDLILPLWQDLPCQFGEILGVIAKFLTVMSKTASVK